MPRLYFQIVCFILLALPALAVAQQNTAKISGTARNEKNEHLPGITILLEETNRGAATNVEGHYEIKGIMPGKYNLSVSGIGYIKQTHPIELKAGQTLIVDIKLDEDSQELEEVVVLGQSISASIKQQAFNVASIQTKKFENTTLDVNQILGQTAGVRIRETGGLGSDFNFFLNGLSGRQVKFFLDGQPLENFGSIFNLNNIPANLVERVDIYKGAVPIHLGADALGGAVNVVTKQDFQDYLDVSYSFGSFNTHRANINGRWRTHNSGFTVGLQSFYNYSDNNYIMRNVETVSEGQFIAGDFERFHDRFHSYLGNMEAGFTNVSWADQFMVGFGYGEVVKELQTASRGSLNAQGNLVIPVAGEARNKEENTRVSLRYSKENAGVSGLTVNAFLSYNTLNSLSIDSTSNRYNWLGEITNTNGSGGEFTLVKTVFDFDQSMFLGNAGLAYDINDNHRLSTNFTWSYLDRQGRNLLGMNGDDPFIDPNTLDKKVLGLAYQLTALDEKLQTTFSGKYFSLGILARESRSYQFGQFTVEDLLTNQNYFGYGLASRYLLTHNLNLKTSYERAYRLPEAFEIFGDGLLILASPTIQPESSHNVNLGGIANWKAGELGQLKTEINGFLRLVDDMIFPRQGGRFISYDNIQSIFIRGMEAEVRYSWNQRIQAGINATYQDVLNNAEFIEGTQQPSIVYRQRMYNTPFFFANADLSYGIPAIGSHDLRLSFFYNASYVQEFFLNYPSIARGGAKFTIPTQFLHHAGVTLSTPQDRYNVSLEVRNLTNALAFDNFALQKPGRAFYMKFRYFLNQF